MADKAEKEEAAPAPKKGGKMMLIVAVVAVIGVFGGGVFAGPKLGHKLHVPGYSSQTPPADEIPPAPGTMAIESCVVDLRVKTGELHHLKIGLVIELNKEIKEKESEQYVARARDAAISYLRSLDYEAVTQTEDFEAIRKALEQKIAKAIGEKDFRRLLFTDFVVQ